MSTAGNLWMAACERALKAVWPHVGRQLQDNAGDFTGTWDINVEATIDPWSKIWIKLRQSERDAAARGLDLACVWKKHRRAEGDKGALDPLEGAVIMRARTFFPMVGRLEWLERRVRELDALQIDAELAFERGLLRGQKMKEAAS